MKFTGRGSARASARSDPAGAVQGTVRVDRRTSSLLARLRPGDIAVLDHLDLDRRTAEQLVAQQVAAVVNAGRFVSGRYPALGAEVLAKAGVVLLDDAGTGVLAARNGASGRVEGDRLLVDGKEVARGTRLDLDAVLVQMDEARAGLATQLESFTHSTTEYLRREQELLLHGRGVPDVATRIAGRPVVVVVRAFDHESDLRRIRRFIREQHPVLVGVDAGADALREARLRPDIVVIGEEGLARVAGGAGERVVSDAALRSAREVVVHADATDRAVGADRLDRIGVRPQRVATSGTSEDLALLLADLKGASLIVTVGTHASLDEFLDRQRSGLASTFLTRLRVGPRLVDAKAVPVVYAGRVRPWHLALVLLAGLVALAAALSTSPDGAALLRDLQDQAQPLIDWIRGLLP
ncbi:putative cytokinetic ring protein SteA [Nocardioides marmoribigeumensis]|uniref:Membrane-anchored protein n=1 Tax=Nocardioides marmoribigeumensis TaxID=433649 RepID=A0ABU2BQM3_9ACTN|nr:putative cytokinetic ring protein SteA [Nocardioides marmoribigeumensis]MDR7360937.1 putative membrane-anchored protein [Nocardioides marmoribigeumensis]